jgi:hypothetical protein
MQVPCLHDIVSQSAGHLWLIIFLVNCLIEIRNINTKVEHVDSPQLLACLGMGPRTWWR